MSGVLTLLRQFAKKKDPFAYISSSDMYARVVTALKKGDELLLQLQVRRGNELTAWAGQYDRTTLEPIGARTFELPGLVTQESVSVVQYLMSIENPSPRIINAIECAIQWFYASRLHGLRVEKVAAKPVRYAYHSSDYDFKEVVDKDAPPIWARFYELDSNRPFMANRDGKKTYKLEEVHRERRTGYT
jgi:PelA/Pel-15E family pectate lyase